VLDLAGHCPPPDRQEPAGLGQRALDAAARELRLDREFSAEDMAVNDRAGPLDLNGTEAAPAAAPSAPGLCFNGPGGEFLDAAPVGPRCR
jgi:hypothetical protein